MRFASQFQHTGPAKVLGRDLYLNWLEEPALNRSVLGSSPRRSTNATSHRIEKGLRQGGPCAHTGMGGSPERWRMTPGVHAVPPGPWPVAQLAVAADC